MIHGLIATWTHSGTRFSAQKWILGAKSKVNWIVRSKLPFFDRFFLLNFWLPLGLYGFPRLPQAPQGGRARPRVPNRWCAAWERSTPSTALQGSATPLVLESHEAQGPWPSSSSSGWLADFFKFAPGLILGPQDGQNWFPREKLCRFHNFHNFSTDFLKIMIFEK